MTDKDGETTLRNRGETEHERVSLIHRSKVVLGVLDKNCTDTPGGGLILYTEDAMSSTSSLRVGGKVAELDPCVDGIDNLRA